MFYFKNYAVVRAIILMYFQQKKSSKTLSRDFKNEKFRMLQNNEAFKLSFLHANKTMSLYILYLYIK